MTKQELIELCHEAQTDVGSLSRFNEKVTKYMYAEWSYKADPVAAFIGALMAINDDANCAVDDFGYYFQQLTYVKDAINELINQ